MTNLVLSRASERDRVLGGVSSQWICAACAYRAVGRARDHL
jgi:hypothetical protein